MSDQAPTRPADDNRPVEGSPAAAAAQNEYGHPDAVAARQAAAQEQSDRPTEAAFDRIERPADDGDSGQDAPGSNQANRTNAPGTSSVEGSPSF